MHREVLHLKCVDEMKLNLEVQGEWEVFSEVTGFLFNPSGLAFCGV